MPVRFSIEISAMPGLLVASEVARREMQAVLNAEADTITARAIDRTPIRTGRTAGAWTSGQAEDPRGPAATIANPLDHAGYVHRAGDPTTVESEVSDDIAQAAPSIAQALSDAAITPFRG